MELWVAFSQFLDIKRNYGCTFQGIFHNFRNYGPDFHSMYGIMTLKSTRIYGIIGTNFSGTMARPCQIIGRDTPPPGLLSENQSSDIENMSCLIAVQLDLVKFMSLKSVIPFLGCRRFSDSPSTTS